MNPLKHKRWVSNFGPVWKTVELAPPLLVDNEEQERRYVRRPPRAQKVPPPPHPWAHTHTQPRVRLTHPISVPGRHGMREWGGGRERAGSARAGGLGGWGGETRCQEAGQTDRRAGGIRKQRGGVGSGAETVFAHSFAGLSLQEGSLREFRLRGLTHSCSGVLAQTVGLHGDSIVELQVGQTYRCLRPANLPHLPPAACPGGGGGSCKSRLVHRLPPTFLNSRARLANQQVAVAFDADGERLKWGDSLLQWTKVPNFE